MEIDLRGMLRIARRRAWIVLIVAALIGGGAFAMAARQPDNYSASARVVVLAGQGSAGSEYNTLLASRSLADTYRLLIETGRVLERVNETLDLPYDFSGLDAKVSTSVVGETQIIEVTVTDHDPQMAARIATTVVEEFQKFITTTVDERIGAQVEVADPARVPTVPFEPRPLFSAVLGMFLGVLLGLGLVAVLEFLDNTIKPEQNIQALAGAPLLATVSALPKLQPGGGQVYALAQPQASASEAIRLLRTNLEFASASGQIKALTVTSARPGEGKSTIVANLGVVLAQTGLRTVIIDADLRKPTQARIFSVPNDGGLTTLLTHPNREWEDLALKVALPGLYLIPSGPIPPNPADLLSSARFEALMERIRNDADMVIIDSPPVLSASDALAVASHTDGVVLVSLSHTTRIDAVRHAAQAVHQGGIRLVGMVINRQKGQRGASYYGEYYGPVTAPESEEPARRPAPGAVGNR